MATDAPVKQDGETSFVNYMDACKNYDAARDALGCNIILGAMAMSGLNKPLNEQWLLDAGCGTGNYVSKVIDKVGAISAHDFSQGMLDKARLKFDKHPKMKAIDQGDCCDLEYSDEQFDAVMSNQVVQHIETDDSRPTRANLIKSTQEACRVLKKGGVYIISTRSKEPRYEDLYWYSILAPKAVAKMEQRVPSREDCVKAMEENGFKVTLACTPKYDSIMNQTHYYDPRGVFSEGWRRGESWWSLVSPEELTLLQTAMKEKIDNGTADAWIKERDELRTRAGQVLFVVGEKI